MDFWQTMRQKLNVQFEEREVKGKWLLACLDVLFMMRRIELHNVQRFPPQWTKLTQLFLVYEKVWPKQRDFWNIKTSLW